MLSIVSNSLSDTREIGKKIGEFLNIGDIVCLSGDLGAGKTVLAKGLVEGLGVLEQVTSPTFTIVNEYSGRCNIYHFDVYRVYDTEELLEMGFEEYIYGEGISIIEWAELIKPILPDTVLWVEIKKDFNKGEDFREIILKPYGKRYEQLLQQLCLGRSESNESSCY